MPVDSEELVALRLAVSMAVPRSMAERGLERLVSLREGVPRWRCWHARSASSAARSSSRTKGVVSVPRLSTSRQNQLP